jgi:hypothetical protein
MFTVQSYLLPSTDPVELVSVLVQRAEQVARECMDAIRHFTSQRVKVVRDIDGEVMAIIPTQLTVEQALQLLKTRFCGHA